MYTYIYNYIYIYKNKHNLTRVAAVETDQGLVAAAATDL